MLERSLAELIQPRTGGRPAAGATPLARTAHVLHRCSARGMVERLSHGRYRAIVGHPELVVK